MADGAKWYVVHTYSGYESKVCTNLEKMVENRQMQDLILETRIPLETVTETVVEDGSSRTRTFEQKLFPGYVLVKMVMSDETWFVVRNTRGVTGFVGAASKPEPLTDSEIEALGIETGADQAAEKRRYVVSFEIGDEVEIIDGPFSGTSGEVEKFEPETGRIWIKSTFFNRETPFEFDLGKTKVVRKKAQN